MNLDTVVKVLELTGAIVVVVATVVAYLRANLAKSTIDTLETSGRAFETRIRQLEGEDARKTARLNAVEAENAMLRSMVTGVEELKGLRSQMTSHQEDVKRTHDQILTGTYAVHDLMLELLKRSTEVSDALGKMQAKP